MHVTIVGTGFVGLVTGACLANTGNRVTCLDVDREKIDKLNAGDPIIYERGLEPLIQRNVEAGRLGFTTDAQKAYGSAEAIFICVGTPSDEAGRADRSAVFAVAEQIGDALDAEPAAPDAPEPIVIVKSTVPIGTGEAVKRAVASRTSRPFAIASNPEFLKEGAAVDDFNKPDRVVIGVEDESTAERLRALYEPFVRQGNPIYAMDIRSAEMVKYAANTMLATKISFVNEVAVLCESYGADVDDVRLGMCADERIGKKFLYPGVGYGGSCFPKDVRAAITMARDAGEPAPLLEAVDEVNQRQRRRFLEKIESHFGEGGLAGTRVGIWGIAFKPGTDDLRDAPALTVIDRLLELGAEVVGYDPVAGEAARARFGARMAYAHDEMAALDRAQALVVCTDCDEFKQPELEEMRRRMAEPTVFDGRNLYHPETMAKNGFTYYSVGRPTARPAAAPALHDA